MPRITTRQSQPSLIRALLEKPQNYSYGMVIKLLRGYFGENVKIATHPELTLAFNASDVSSIKIYDLSNLAQTIDGRCIAHTELSSNELFRKIDFYESKVEQAKSDIKDEKELAIDLDDNFSTSDFLNVLNEPIYNQYHTAWCKYSIFERIVENNDSSLIERIFCFAGLSFKKIREQNLNMFDVLPYIGIFSMIPRSVAGLKAILCGEFGSKVSIDEFATKLMSIPQEQRMSLGIANTNLGEDA